jgi:hypothetical protein
VLHISKNCFDSVEMQTSYASCIHVELSATEPVSIVLTNYKHLITIYYPVSGSPFSSGSFNIQVLDGISCLEIYPPESYDSAVTLTIMLFY